MKTLTLFLLIVSCCNAASRLIVTNHTADPIRIEVTDGTVWTIYAAGYATLDLQRPQTANTATIEAFTVPAGDQIGSSVNLLPNGSWLYCYGGSGWEVAELESDHVPEGYLWGMMLTGFSVVGGFIALMAGMRVTRMGERTVFQ